MSRRPNGLQVTIVKDRTLVLGVIKVHIRPASAKASATRATPAGTNDASEGKAA